MRQEISYKYEERDPVKEEKEREAWLEDIRDMNATHLFERVKQKIEEEDESDE
tara:strand:+ start:393 stop:551 length:159 start_codon:yes stop_codon:yes gene_type:complete